MLRTSLRSPTRPSHGMFNLLKAGFLGIGVTSCIINVLALTGSFFMLQVYDRVIPSHSLPTLVGLVVIVVVLFVFYWLLDLIRSLLLGEIGRKADERYSASALASLSQTACRKPSAGDGVQSIRDIDTLRGFLSGPGPGALFDMPWMPFYLGLCFLFHPWIGVTATIGAAIIVGLAFLAEIKSRQSTKESVELLAERMAFAQATRRNSEVISAMGFAPQLSSRWAEISRRYLDSHSRAGTVSATLSTLSRSARMLLQSGVLAVGAALVVRQEATGGIMIASSILISRSLAPVELAIAHWKGFAAARLAYFRLEQEAHSTEEAIHAVALPAPEQLLEVNNLHLGAPGSASPIIRGLSFEAKAGEVIGVVGASASGKTSLARAMVGLWPAFAGDIRLDGASLTQWSRAALGHHIGYLPQDASLFDGTIAENIARFDAEAPSERVITAARAAGIYEMVTGFADGFDTRIGEQGMMLSAGQRQRIGLARALYGNPFLVVLDEPNSNLDREGEQALTQAIEQIRSRKGIVLVMTHRTSVLSVCDKVLLLEAGRAKAFGPTAQVLGTGAKRTAATGSFVQLMRAGGGTSR